MNWQLPFKDLWRCVSALWKHELAGFRKLGMSDHIRQNDMPNRLGWKRRCGWQTGVCQTAEFDMAFTRGPNTRQITQDSFAVRQQR